MRLAQRAQPGNGNAVRLPFASSGLQLIGGTLRHVLFAPRAAKSNGIFARCFFFSR